MKDIENFYQRASTLLASQFRESDISGDKTNIQKLIAALVTPCYDINTVELQLYNDRFLATAVGVQLDAIGTILGLARLPGQSDSSYRESLYFQVRINSSTGTPEEMIAALKFLTQATFIQYLEPHPAFYQMFTNGQPSSFSIPPDLIVQAISDISPAGVQYVPISWYYQGGLIFEFNGDPIVEDFYVAPDPSNLSTINPFDVSPDGIVSDQFQINRGQTSDRPDIGSFAEDNYTLATAGALVEVLVINGDIPPT